jgi:hypothetical protein
MSLAAARFHPLLDEAGDTTSTADGRRILVDIAAASVDADATADPAIAGVKLTTTATNSPSGAPWPLVDIEVRLVGAAATTCTWRPWTRSANSGGWHKGALRTVTVAAGRTFERDSVQFSVVARDRVYVQLVSISAGTFDAWANAQLSQAGA